VRWSPAAPAFWAVICATLLLVSGYEVVCLDNFLTGNPSNIAHLLDDGTDRHELL